MNISRHFQGSFFWNAHNIGKFCLICPEVLLGGNPLPDTCSQPCSHHTPTICAGEISSFPLQSRHLYRSDWLIDGTYLYCATVYSFWSCIPYKCRPIFCISWSHYPQVGVMGLTIFDCWLNFCKSLQSPGSAQTGCFAAQIFSDLFSHYFV